MNYNFYVDGDIKKARTLPSDFYKDELLFQSLKDSIFRRSWQWVGDHSLLPFDQYAYPIAYLDGFLSEPLVLSKDKNGAIHCLSNVCTHRGNIVVHHPGQQRRLSCLYHGRRFHLDGQFQYMPEFEEVENFPAPCDHLKSFPLQSWKQLLFVGLSPSFDLRAILNKMEERIGFLPLDEMKLDQERSKDYLVKAHWALYCDNYLEGFHIPFVHQGLNAVIDYDAYKTEIYDYFNLQIGYTDDALEVFDLPSGHPDYGRKVAGYYYWIFPNMMFNFYPWGLSINIVKPISINRTRVSFLSYVFDPSKLDQGAGADLDKVEREDEFVVEGVYQGIQSAYYQSGRFSPKREQGVHHFHRLLAQFVNEGSNKK